MSFSPAFRPACNKDGYSRCEYMDYEIKKGIKEYKNSKGETVKEPWTMLLIKFEVRGIVRGSVEMINLACDNAVDKDNELPRARNPYICQSMR